MEARDLSLAVKQGDFLYLPAVFADAPSARTRTARLELALALADELEGGFGARGLPLVAKRVLEADDALEIRRALQGSELVRRIERRSMEPAWLELRELYGIGGLRYPSARLAACLAADVTWMPHAHGMLLARDRSPSSIGTDVRTLAAMLYHWAVQVYPAVARALSAALTTDDGAKTLPFTSLSAVIVDLVGTHIGGSFAEPRQFDLLEDVARRFSCEFVGLLTGQRMPPFTGPRLTGWLFDALAESLGDLIDFGDPDPVMDFERAAAELVFNTIEDGAGTSAAIAALDELRRGMRAHLA